METPPSQPEAWNPGLQVTHLLQSSVLTCQRQVGNCPSTREPSINPPKLLCPPQPLPRRLQTHNLFDDSDPPRHFSCLSVQPCLSPPPPSWREAPLHSGLGPVLGVTGQASLLTLPPSPSRTRKAPPSLSLHVHSPQGTEAAPLPPGVTTSSVSGHCRCPLGAKGRPPPLPGPSAQVSL